MRKLSKTCAHVNFWATRIFIPSAIFTSPISLHKTWQKLFVWKSFFLGFPYSDTTLFSLARESIRDTFDMYIFIYPRKVWRDKLNIREIFFPCGETFFHLVFFLGDDFFSFSWSKTFFFVGIIRSKCTQYVYEYLNHMPCIVFPKQNTKTQLLSIQEKKCRDWTTFANTNTVIGITQY